MPRHTTAGAVRALRTAEMPAPLETPLDSVRAIARRQRRRGRGVAFRDEMWRVPEGKRCGGVRGAHGTVVCGRVTWRSGRS
jgi:hypothetical protein